MGAKSREKKRQKKDATQGKGAYSGFHMTIGVSPDTTSISSSQFNKTFLENDLRLVKAAILYADKARLCSLSTSMALTILSLGTLSPRDQLELYEQIVPSMSLNRPDIDQDASIASIRTIKQMLEKHPATLNKDQRQKLRMIENTIAGMWKPMQDKVEEMFTGSGVDGLIRAIQAGLLDIHILGSSSNTTKTIVDIANTSSGKKKKFSTDTMVNEFIETLANAINDGRTYPFFDTTTADIIKLAVDEGKLSVSEMGLLRGKHSVLAGRLLERLPLFDMASIDEIIDIRKELENPLIRFRQAIMNFSKDVKVASWDKDFAIEVDNVFHKDIQPAVVEIEEMIKTNKSLVSVLNRAVSKPVVAGGVLAALLSQLSSLPELASIAMIGGTVGAVSTVVSVYHDYLETQRKAEQNQLYFYYRAGERLLSA